MNRVRGRVGVLAVISMIAAACGGTTVAPSTSTVTSTVTDTFDGTLNRNGAIGFPFTVLSSGTVTAQFTVISGDTPPRIGLGVGTWDNSSNSCSTANGKFSDNATTFSLVTVSALSAGTLCVRVYDSQANVVGPVVYQVQVTHP